ncbi:lactate utilization protein B/C [Terasakiispira papahanaumokuakeensis]|uniref:Lactate utilization protein B/C n=1 Tax=Terasakiispira papahanaumokuakeensis TaxID=197479 RepID=A0A1E2VBM1_9GAMM|nr:lactate utilization protein [Terasakiispira papahanaumokuakeensis]ODC04379.1 lactate utilization protein B/C [Terasakiispira papahanaumokuakeensis]
MTARQRILQKLRERRGGPLKAPAADLAIVSERDWQPEEKLALFTQMIESVQGEVHRVDRTHWCDELASLLAQRHIQQLLIPRQHTVGQQIRDAADQAYSAWPRLRHYDQTIEQWQPELFHEVDAAITSTRGAIAETGSLILWPTQDEPRLASLVPPLHIAVLEADQVYATFHEAITTQQWANGMPTNALLISGPSKTADIEQTLAYGVHGPKALLVLILESSAPDASYKDNIQ